MSSSISNLINNLLGGGISVDDKNQKPISQPTKSNTYQYPLKSFKIIGTFLPGQYVNKAHPTGHWGVDLQAPKGSPIYPIAAGIVIDTGFNPKGGNYVKTSHDNGKVIAYYAHLDSINCQKGQEVNYDTVIGTCGQSGNAGRYGTSAHVHLSVENKWKLY